MTLDELDSWLSSDEAPEDSMMLSDLDGFLTALVAGPVFVHPEIWLPSVWGNKNIVQPAGRDGERALQAIVARYNAISYMLANTPDDWAPIFWQHPDGTTIPAIGPRASSTPSSCRSRPGLRSSPTTRPPGICR